MLLSDARSLAKILYFSATSKSNVDDLQWNLVLNSANKAQWAEAVAHIASLFAKDTPDTATDSTGLLDYSGTLIDANGVYMILAVEIKFLGRYLHINYEIPQDRYVYNLAFGQIQALIPSAFTIIGEKIKLLPNVSASNILRVTYVPSISDLTADNQSLLSGLVPMHHELIVHEAVSSMVPPMQSANVIAMRDKLRSSWKRFLTSRQRQEGRNIRFVPYE
jgi:hypothetical protein